MADEVRGYATFFDGRVPRRRTVNFAFGSGRLVLSDEAGAECAAWPRAAIRRAPERAGLLRLAIQGSDARLEISEAGGAFLLERALAAEGGPLAALGSLSRRAKLRLVGGTVLALGSLAAFVVFGLPLIIHRLVPLIPVETEVLIGTAINDRVLETLGGKGRRACAGAEGQEALARLAVRMDQVAKTGFKVRISVVDLAVPNAVALPGGRIVVFRGLIGKVASAEQLAAVLAHEYGHVAHRDGLKVLAEAAGLGLVFSLVTGDFTGYGITVLGLQAVVQARYTREVETEADLYAIDLMVRLGADPAELAKALEAITAGVPMAMENSFLSSHPATAERVKALRDRVAALPAGSPPAPLFVTADWLALTTICAL